MPPRVQLTPEESARLPKLLEQVAATRDDFPADAAPHDQAAWVQRRYSGAADAPISLNLVTLLLFEHGVHRSVDQVARDLAIMRDEPHSTVDHHSEG